MSACGMFRFNRKNNLGSKSSRVAQCISWPHPIPSLGGVVFSCRMMLLARTCRIKKGIDKFSCMSRSERLLLFCIFTFDQIVCDHLRDSF